MLPLSLNVNQTVQPIGISHTIGYGLTGNDDLPDVRRDRSRGMRRWTVNEDVDQLCRGCYQSIFVRALIDHSGRVSDEGNPNRENFLPASAPSINRFIPLRGAKPPGRPRLPTAPGFRRRSRPDQDDVVDYG